jgi:L-aspartate oxidase
MMTHEVEDYYGHFRVTTDLIELRNLLQCAGLIVRSALHRKESRGLHYTLDYPDLLPQAVDTVLVP